MVARQDRSIKSKSKGNWCPVARVPGNSSARHMFHVLVEGPRNDLDHIALDELVNDIKQLLSLLARQAPLADDGGDPLLQLTPRLLPLLLGNQALEVRVGEQLPASPTQQLSHEHARIDARIAQRSR